MRGEDVAIKAGEGIDPGSPPHARGRRAASLSHIERFRITPACAGKTRFALLRRGVWKDHPRMRGEDGPFAADMHDVPRITPACAGKTQTPCELPTLTSDHPRMRGEDEFQWHYIIRGQGSPPHARGRLRLCHGVDGSEGITPACAGKTAQCKLSDGGKWDHPRMRGEDVGEFDEVRQLPRITPACAGKTVRDGFVEQHLPDHPRMRGEDVSLPKMNLLTIGSPPHARGRRDHPRMRGEDLGDHPRMRGEDRL